MAKSESCDVKIRLHLAQQLLSSLYGNRKAAVQLKW